MKHYNPQLATDAQRIFKLKQGDMLDSQVVPNIQPTKEIKPLVGVIAAASGGAVGTLHTTDANRDTFLTGVSFAVSTDAAKTGSMVYVDAVIDGVTCVLAYVAIPVGALAASSIYVPFNELKVDRNTAIRVQANGTFASHGTSIHGYVN